MLVYFFLSYASFVIHVASIPLYMLLTPIYLIFNKANKLNKNIFVLIALFIWPIIYTFLLNVINQHNIDITTEISLYIIHAMSFLLVSSFIYTKFNNYLGTIEILLKLVFATVILDIICGVVFSKPLISFLPLLEDIFSNNRFNIIPLLGLNIPRTQGLMSEPSYLGILFNILLFILIISGRYKNYYLFLLFVVQIATVSISSIPFTLINLFLVFKRSKSLAGFVFLFFLVLSAFLVLYLLGDLVTLIKAAIMKLGGEGASGSGRIAKLILLLDLLKESMFLGKGIDYFVFINGTNTGNYIGLFLIEGGLISLILLLVCFFIIYKNLIQNYGLIETFVSIFFILLSLLTHSSTFPVLFLLPMIHFLTVNKVQTNQTKY